MGEVKQSYYLKCNSTVDEFLNSLIYFKNQSLFRQLETIESNRGPKKY